MKKGNFQQVKIIFSALIASNSIKVLIIFWYHRIREGKKVSILGLQTIFWYLIIKHF